MEIVALLITALEITTLLITFPLRVPGRALLAHMTCSSGAHRAAAVGRGESKARAAKQRRRERGIAAPSSGTCTIKLSNLSGARGDVPGWGAGRWCRCSAARELVVLPSTSPVSRRDARGVRKILRGVLVSMSSIRIESRRKRGAGMSGGLWEGSL